MSTVPPADILDPGATEDDGIRPLKGVVASLRQTEDSALCLTFDDVGSPGAQRDKAWRFNSFYTKAEFSSGLVRNMALTDDQYRDIGVALMARLVSQYESGLDESAPEDGA